MPVYDSGITPSQLQAMFLTAVGLTDRYTPAFERLLFEGGVSAAEAIAAVEEGR